ncbi:uncharacterized protein LOC112505697 isoform X1 [Cynara cardunculus var. scolymus]|uniref:uncharacterized protein LOC112505697 isoform X1 n=2 Tax=Cynara cardunculus var. scolymus TaxID=59895 RepID=UPI000D626F1E|nr:uncharacterized protein LOC112505697 isoform X1 [Cynara cardunculus var. scolymus]XP_024965388.1 uncharacterized protein LOC112505697 isoform X1 [Cynara cardunculus var. scolymus]XP_024965389.1 uncharacterized protein LOC112505697 isoform X1 [Cynara cardunculus var. scolymus]XP_024965390.1 uncharacterized protein LOC112505697 isoform X1 [Cynara cardunculus var. scolymus]XP_024965391.1 uncharacterized protein LOC112505697 isoform X1 [Cynara cardunculus var. scolymus]
MMNTTEDWKSLWPISSVHSPPLLLSPATTTAASRQIGPVIFKPQTHNHLFTSSSVSPHIPPFPNLSLSRFLYTSSSLLPSTTTSIASQLFSSSFNPDRLLAHNSLQLLRCPGTNSTLAFFPTGSNSDQVGFVILSVENSQLTVRGAYGENEFLTSKNALTHRIVKISASPLADCDCTSGDLCDSTIGYLLVSTSYSLHYYSVRIRKEGSGRITPGLELLGNKLFKSSAIVHACWSPHLPEESLVLLESGDLFLFDLDSCSEPSISSLRLTGKKVKVLWDQSLFNEKGGWLSCDFSWHPRVLIVVHSSVVFLVDLRSEKYNVIPLLKLGSEHVEDDRFVAFSIAAPDRFYFTLASKHMLFLCDLRKPMVPLLRWAHNVANPSYIVVSSLSELRSLSEDVTFSWASEAGYGIILGSFWNSEFSLFCYGPDVRESVSSEISSCGKSFYAWGLPSDLSLVTHECGCGSCIVKEEFSKDRFPHWINWQQKKEFVLGFGILAKEISSQLFEPDRFGGFTLITMTSLGNFESHRYSASWDYSQTSQKGHTDQALDLEDSLLYDTSEEGYKFRKVFGYLKLEWLNGYLKSDLGQILSRELIKTPDNESANKAYFGEDFHENICQKLQMFSSGGSHWSLEILDVFKEIGLPTSAHEIALRSLWANLPKKVLRFGFSTYSDLLVVPKNLKQAPFEFLEIPCHQPHLPPFFFRFPSFRSSKWSGKHKPSDSLVGPLLPIPFLMTFHKAHMLRADNKCADMEIDLKCEEVMRVANEVTALQSERCNDHAVSLADDNEDMFHSSQNLQSFASYKPVAFSSKLSMEDFVFEDEKHTNLLFRVGQKDEKEIFDSDCPLKFKFDKQATSFGPKEMKAYKLLKRQYSNFKGGFSSYQDYMTKSNLHKYQLDVGEIQIAHLDTGAGKTMIGVMIINKVAVSIKKKPSEKKSMVFLAPIRNLVEQVLRYNTNLMVDLSRG